MSTMIDPALTAVESMLADSRALLLAPNSDHDYFPSESSYQDHTAINDGVDSGYRKRRRAVSNMKKGIHNLESLKDDDLDLGFLAESTASEFGSEMLNQIGMGQMGSHIGNQMVNPMNNQIMYVQHQQQQLQHHQLQMQQQSITSAQHLQQQHLQQQQLQQQHQQLGIHPDNMLLMQNQHQHQQQQKQLVSMQHPNQHSSQHLCQHSSQHQQQQHQQQQQHSMVQAHDMSGIDKSQSAPKDRVKKRRKRATGLGDDTKITHFQHYEWNQHFAALLQYGLQHGHYNVPCKDVYECDIVDTENPTNAPLHYVGHLGKWLTRQRQFKKRPNITQLPPERENQLQQLVNEGKFMWEGQSSIGKPQKGYSWQTNFSALIQYVKQYGHGNVPLRDEYRCELPNIVDTDGKPFLYCGNLGKWLAHQRRSKRGKGTESKLSRLLPDREFLLQQLVDDGKLLWNASELSSSCKSKAFAELSWPRHYAALVMYSEEFGHCNVAHKTEYECELQTYDVDGNVQISSYKGSLGNWLHNQRQCKKGNGYPLSPERQALLQKLVDESKFVIQ